MDQEQKRKNTTVAQTVAEKFGKLDGSGRAYVLRYLLGKADERSMAAESKDQQKRT